MPKHKYIPPNDPSRMGEKTDPTPIASQITEGQILVQDGSSGPSWQEPPPLTIESIVTQQAANRRAIEDHYRDVALVRVRQEQCYRDPLTGRPRNITMENWY
jgi:hypothetical protein